jgi:cysteine-rich repeat protein
VAQTVTVTGQPHGAFHGDVNYSVSLGASASADPLYVALSDAVALVNGNVDFCGDGNLDNGEQCDDANVTTCDGCESCQRRRWLTLPANVSANVPGITAALPRGDMCVEAWAKVGPPPSGQAALVTANSAGNNSAFELFCQNGAGLVGRVAFAHVAGAVVMASADGTNCSDGNWHHYAGCRAVVGATVTNTVYLDGVLRATASGGIATIGVNAAVYFGGTPYGSDGLAGAIDEVRISTGLRYTANFAPVRRLAADAATLALWHLDEGAGTTFADASGNGYSGTLAAGAGWATDTGYSLALCQ